MSRSCLALAAETWAMVVKMGSPLQGGPIGMWSDISTFHHLGDVLSAAGASP